MLLHREKTFLHNAYVIPPEICRKMLQGASYFEEIEIWRKRQIRKDPIAVGITAKGTHLYHDLVSFLAISFRARFLLNHTDTKSF